jgi:hypothetical protein
MGRLTKTCLGCRKRCTKPAWGNWCHPCNVERMTRMNKNVAEIARSIGQHELADQIENQ